ncbi:MAG: DUF2066 domain-containing protein [Gammaproteobacteria bacterium]
MCFSLVGHVRAVELAHLYEATVPVQDQNKEQRNQAIQQAFVQVLIRVSGRSDVGNAQTYPDIAQATQDVTRFVQQFRYIKTDNSSGSGSNTSGANAQQSGLAVWVRFDETAISHLLRASNLPVWGSTRPSTLVWLAVEQHGQRKLLGADSRNDAYNLLTSEATSRGVPLVLPLLDLTDRSAIHTSDVWGNFGNTILQASQRYQTEAVLVGRVYQANSSKWVGRWTLYVDSGSENWSESGASLADVLDAGVDNTAQSLAQRYGQVDQADIGTVLIEVKDIKGLADFNRTVKYLKSISHVKDVEPVELTASSAVFQVKIPGGRLAVARDVSLGQVLAADESDNAPVESLSSETAATPENQDPGKVIPDLTYRLQP